MQDEEDFLNAQSQINQELATAMIEATPENWNAIKLEIEQENVNGNIAIKHKISSPEGHDDLIMATDEIISATSKLSFLFESNNKPWKKVECLTAQNNEGNWSIECQFTY